MKNILFVCTGNSARSIIAESIINKYHKEKFNAFSAGSNPKNDINEAVKLYLETLNYDLSKSYPKSFKEFLNSKIEIDYVITVCSNAHNEICPIWPNQKRIIHWEIEDPVIKINEMSKKIHQENVKFTEEYWKSRSQPPELKKTLMINPDSVMKSAINMQKIVSDTCKIINNKISEFIKNEEQ